MTATETTRITAALRTAQVRIVSDVVSVLMGARAFQCRGIGARAAQVCDLASEQVCGAPLRFATGHQIIAVRAASLAMARRSVAAA